MDMRYSHLCIRVTKRGSLIISRTCNRTPNADSCAHQMPPWYTPWWQLFARWGETSPLTVVGLTSTVVAAVPSSSIRFAHEIFGDKMTKNWVILQGFQTILRQFTRRGIHCNIYDFNKCISKMDNRMNRRTRESILGMGRYYRRHSGRFRSWQDVKIQETALVAALETTSTTI